MKVGRFALAALGGLLLGRSAAAQQVECDGTLPEVRRLDFTGNTTYRDDQLALLIETSPSGWLRRVVRVVGQRYCYDSTVARVTDVARLRLYYRDRGFVGTQVRSEVTPMGAGKVGVRYRIVEGRPLLIDSLAVNGLENVTNPERLVRNLPLRAGDRLDRGRMAAMRDSLTRRLRNNGYPLAEVFQNYDTDTSSLRAVVWYDVAPGNRMRLGHIPVRIDKARGTGSEIGIHPGRVLATLGIDSGDVFSERDLEGVKRGLYLTEAYQHVDVSVDTTSLADSADSLVTVEVHLVEGELHGARTAVGWGDYECLRAQGNYTTVAFLGGLRRVDVTGRLARMGLCRERVRRDFISGDERNYYLGATYTQPPLFGRRAFPAFTLFTEKRSEYLAYLRETRIGANASLQLGGRVPVSLSYQLEQGSTRASPAYFCGVFNVCDQDTIDELLDDRRTAVFGISAVRSTANDVADPSGGSMIRVELRHASPGVGSDRFVEFTRGIVDAARYFRLPGDGRFVVRVRAGKVFSEQRLGSLQRFIPPQERLYAGGPTSVRGYQANQLGSLVYRIGTGSFEEVVEGGELYYRVKPGAARLEPDQPTGGDNVLVVNAEARLRSPIYPELLQWAVFADAGQVWNDRSPSIRSRLKSLKTTPGIGVRAFTPIGPVRLDVALAPRVLPAGPVYFIDTRANIGSVPNPDVGQVYCVSPGNRLPITAGEDGARQQAAGTCPSAFVPPRSKGINRLITFQFAIGQAF